MADHLDAPDLMPPGGDASIDITDIYVFQSPRDPDRSVLIMNVNPLTLAPSFNPDALYEILVDTDGGPTPIQDIAFRFKFSPFLDGSQTVSVRRATGEDAVDPASAGEVLFEDAPVSFRGGGRRKRRNGFEFFAGVRSDPFFFDLSGFLDGFTFTGDDFFIDKNVFGIVLEVPKSELGASSSVGVWGRVLVPNGGALEQVERMGRPAINTVLIPTARKNLFNTSEPKDDLAIFSTDVITSITTLSGAANAAALVGVLLPDVNTFDPGSPDGFLNGRNLTDDVIDAELSLLTAGAVTTDGVPPHTDLKKTFPFMGKPHKVR